MTLCTSGDWHCDQSRILTEEIHAFMCKEYPQLNDVVIEVNQVELTNEHG